VSIFVFPSQEGDCPLTRPYLFCYIYYLPVTTDVATILSAGSILKLDDSPYRSIEDVLVPEGRDRAVPVSRATGAALSLKEMHDMTMQTEALTEEHAATLAYIHAVDDPEVPDERFKLWTPQDLLDNNAPPVWTIKALVISPTYGMLAGAEKSLKSYIAQFIAVGAAGGVPVLGQFEVPQPVPVLMFVGEGGRLPYTRRLERIAAAYGVNLADLPLLTSFDVASTQSDVFQHNFVQHLKDHHPAITIIEPWYAFHGAASEGKNLHREGDQLVWLSHTAQEYGSSLIIGNHFNQTGSGSDLKRITGAGPAEWSEAVS